MPVNKEAENALATIGTILWMIQLTPQILKSYREKSTEGLSPWLMSLWALSAPFLGVYMIAQNISIPLIVQPQLFGAMSAFSWVQCCYYGGKKSKIYCATIYVSFLGAAGGFQGGLSKFIRHRYQAGDLWSLRIFAILSSVFLSVGLLPQYWEIWKRKEVVGVSILFMFVDLMGGVFSAISLVFKPSFDTYAAIPYLLVVVLDAGVIILAVVLNPTAKRRRRQDNPVAETIDLSELKPS
ncbi:hypothetical protein BDV93DRAFT_587035 [Ceratobasidium sp. AG-I]|nr:hypothetical protein BDV93DRAFT_587035 [Ceratobasidium sp. AG-I]